MAYTKTVWVNDSKPAINADNLNKIELGIEANDAAITENTEAIAENKTAIAENKTAIAENKTAIAENKTAIAENKTAIAENKTAIAENKTAITSTTKSYTLSASLWSDGAYTISDALITATSNQEVLPAVDITLDQLKALQKAMLVDGGQSVGKLTLKAMGTVPTIDIPIRIIFRGTI